MYNVKYNGPLLGLLFDCVFTKNCSSNILISWCFYSCQLFSLSWEAWGSWCVVSLLAFPWSTGKNREDHICPLIFFTIKKYIACYDICFTIKSEQARNPQYTFTFCELRKLSIDTSSAQSFKALKSFFTYVDDLEYIVNKKRLDEKEFREALNKLTGLQVSEEESDFIFRMLDANKDGLISTENELKFSKSNNDKWYMWLN